MPINGYMEANVFSNDCDNIETLGKAAAKIAYHNFKWHYVTLIMMNTAIFCGVNAFLESYNKTAVVATENLIPNFHQNTRQFILFGDNLLSIVQLIKWIEEHNLDNTGRFLIICQSDECNETEAVEALWDHKIINVIFINYKQKSGAMGYTYDFGKNCDNSPPILVKDWNYCINIDKKYCKRKYPIKFRNLYGCQVVVSTFNQSPYMQFNNGVPTGADGDLLNIIIEALNASLVVMAPARDGGWGTIDENGIWIGSLGDLYYDLANFSMTSASITQTRYNNFQMSNFYYTLNLGWVTHPPELEAASYKLLRPFEVDSRIALGISFIAVIIIVLFLKMRFCVSIFRNFSSERDPDSVLFLSWEMCMGQPTLTFPSKMALSYFVLLWIWYCFLMRTFYQVHLINSLKNDVYMGELLSIEQAFQENYPFGGGSALKDYFAEQPFLYNNWVIVDSNKYFSIMISLSNGTRFVLAMNLATAKHYIKESGQKMHILPETILTSPTVIFFKKFSPLAQPVNRILERLVEFGWPEKFFRDNTMAKKQISEEEDKPITLSNFTGCYVILLSGWILSTIMLFIEIYYMKKQIRSTIMFRN